MQKMTEWTVDTLKEHYDQRFTDVDKAVSFALAAVEKANAKSETAAEKRFELLNELRDGVVTTEQLESVKTLVNGLNDRMNRADGKSTGLSSGWGYLVGAIGLASAVISILTR
jgi:hypothetical protein